MSGAALVVVVGMAAAYPLSGTDRRDGLVAESPPPSASEPRCTAPLPSPEPDPLPTRNYAPDDDSSIVYVRMVANCTTVRVGEVLRVKVFLSGDAALPSIERAVVDGATTLTERPRCPSDSPPRARQAASSTVTLNHVYARPQTDILRVEAGVDCSGYTGTGASELAITVLPPSSADPDQSVGEPRWDPNAQFAPFGTQDVQISATVNPERPAVGEEVLIEVTAAGFAEKEPFLQGPQIDGQAPGWIAGSCAAATDPRPPQAEPQVVRRTVRHTFDTPGRHEIAFRASGGCTYFRGEDELVIVVEVQLP